jgi:hypothetical protein
MKTAFWGIALLAAAGTIADGAQAQVSLSIAIAPPALPVYAQPAMPGDGYMWTPGYWSWNAPDNDYYWVPGTWVSAPYVGALWTPGYWGWGGAGYAWHGGYWGTHIGYYGGINYGFGYGGVGYQGGYWSNGAFSYNRSVNNVGSIRIAHVYNTRIENATVNRVSYNGGNGGIRLQPSKAEASIASMPHNAPTAPQLQHEQASRTNQDLRASVNHGLPKIAATPEPGAFGASGVVAARAPQTQPARRMHAVAAAVPPAREQAHGENVERQPSQIAAVPQAKEPTHAGNAQRQPAQHEEERHEK